VVTIRAGAARDRLRASAARGVLGDAPSIHDADTVHGMTARALAGDTLTAGLAGAVLAGIPSTAWSLARGDDVLDGARAAGAIVLPGEQRTPVLLAAAVPVHLALSLGWAQVLAAVLPRGGEPLTGAVAGLGIAALDLVVIGRRIPAIRALPQGRQWADHVAYGLAVGVALRLRRRAAGPA
jgi:hypothetical protein